MRDWKEELREAFETLGEEHYDWAIVQPRAYLSGEAWLWKQVGHAELIKAYETLLAFHDYTERLGIAQHSAGVY